MAIVRRRPHISDYHCIGSLAGIIMMILRTQNLAALLGAPYITVYFVFVELEESGITSFQAPLQIHVAASALVHYRLFFFLSFHNVCRRNAPRNRALVSF